MASTSYLDGDEWTLRTRVLRKDTHDITLTHDAAIRATHDTRKKWNAQFWSLFPQEPDLFRANALHGDIAVTIMFRFRPTIRLKETYGGQPVLEIARASDAWRSRGAAPPATMAVAIDEYERDKRRLEEQRRHAWVELTSLRLPAPPFGYAWELASGDPRSYSDVLNFRLKTK